MIIGAIGVSMSSTAALAQLSTTPPAELPEVVVEGERKAKKKKAPAAAQQSSTPRASETAPSTDPVRAPDTSDVAGSPTSVATPVDQLASSVTVITSKEIEAQQRRTLPDVLRMVPGLNVVQTGGPGGQTSVFMRGTESNHVKVVIDGIDVRDPSNPNGSFDFANLLTADIERVEVLRGAQSGLYGSDAIGGVIAIYTKKGEGPPKVTSSIEGGSFGTFNQSVGARGGAGRFNYAFNISHFKADEIPVTPKEVLLPGQRRFDNRYDNWTYSGKIGVDLTPDLTLNFVARYTDSQLWFTGDGFTSPNQYQSGLDVNHLYTRSEAVWRALDGRVTSYFGFNYADLSNDNLRPDSFYDGERTSGDWRTIFDVAHGYKIVTGANYQLDAIDVAGGFGAPVDVDEWNRGAFVELQSEPVKNLFLVANVRYDDFENFGGHETWRVAPAYVIEATGTKLKGSVGTGFKAPSLSERFRDTPAFGFFANPNLKPEESTGYDAGFEQSILSDRARFGATYFYNDITNLIDYNDMFTTNINIGQATTEGVEIFAAADVTDRVRVRVDYTYTEARNEDDDSQLLRRPRNKASLSVGWTPIDPLLLTGSVTYLDDAADFERFGSISVREDYTLVNIAADYKLNGNMSLFGRIDNLLDESYQDPLGWEGTGIGAYAGVRFNN